MNKWRVLAGAAIGCATGVGPLLYLTFGLYLKPMTEAFGWSRAEFALTFTASSLAAVFSLPIVGYFIDKFGPRVVAFVGIFALAAAYASFALVQGLPLFIFISVIAGLTGMIAGVPTYLAAIPGWFDKRRGLALGIASSGSALGAALLPFLINFGFANYGFRGTFVLVAVVSAVIALISWMFLFAENKGELPSEEYRKSGQSDANVAFSVAIRSVDFWRLSVSFALVVMVALGINFHLAAMLGDRGFSATQAALAVSVVAGSSLIGRPLAGAIVDLVSPKAVGCISFTAQALGVVLLIVSPGFGGVIAALILIGLAYGVEGDLLAFSLVRRFGRATYGRLFTIAYGIIAIAQLTSPLVLGIAFDRLGSYTSALAFFPALSLIAVLLLALSRIDRPAEADSALAPRNELPAAGPLSR